MSPKSSSYVVAISCLVFVLFSSCEAIPFNITRLLGRFPEFSTFNSLLNQTGIAKEINSRQTITILAVDNDAIGTLSGKQLDVVKRILSVHVILDYFDVPKILHMSKKSSIVTNLYQTTGVASYEQGYLNITVLPNNNIGFGSAIKGAPIDIKLVKMVASQPYDFSVLQVSGVIVAPGITGDFPPPPAPKTAPVPAAAPPPKEGNPAPSPDDEEEEEDEAADAPEVEAPADAPTDAPASSPPVSADESDADDDSAPAPDSESSSTSLMSLSFSFFAGLVVLLVSSLAA